MLDYYTKFELMRPEQLTDELQKLNKKLVKLNSGSPMYNQLLSIIQTGQHIYHEKLLSIGKNEDSSDVFDIGEIESVVVEPIYNSNEELIIEVAKMYTSKGKNK